MDAAGSSTSFSAVETITNSIQALGRGFDASSDIRLLYCKSSFDAPLVVINEDDTKDLVVSDSLVLSGISIDVECTHEKPHRETTPVWGFHEMAEFFNKRSDVSGDLPLGAFNSLFSFSGHYLADAASVQSLAMDDYFVPFCKFYLRNTHLLVHNHLRNMVPRAWEPSALSSFIRNYGTHVITSITIGGRDVVCLKQLQSSSLSALEIKNFVEEIGDQRFHSLEDLAKSPSIKDKDVSIIFRRRGGDDLVASYSHWITTVETSPDVINMTFVPIVSLLEDLPGIKYLESAIKLYLKYKPPIEELEYFLDFQLPRAWASAPGSHPGHDRKQPVCPALQLSLMGPKLYISPDQVSVGRKPVTGLRLFLDGVKHNQLSIHVQYLVSLPKILQPHWGHRMAIGALRWHGPEEQDNRWFEPIKWKNFSYICTAPIESTDSSVENISGVCIVTGAQLCVWDFGSKTVLYLKLLFASVPGCTLRRSVWDHNPNTANQNGDASPSFLMERAISDDMKIHSTTQVGKLMKIVDIAELSKGPQDMPGHWIVTGAKFGIEKGKIVIRVKYSLLNY